EQKVEPVGLGVMIVVQPVLQFAHEGKARRLGVEAEAMKAVFADIECQPTDHRPQHIKLKDAGGEADDERGQAKRQPDIGAMPQKGSDQGGLQVVFCIHSTCAGRMSQFHQGIAARRVPGLRAQRPKQQDQPDFNAAKAVIKRCLMAWPSRSGKTRGVSSGAIRADTKTGPSPTCSKARISSASSRRETARASRKRQARAMATRSMPACV